MALGSSSIWPKPNNIILIIIVLVGLLLIVIIIIVFLVLLIKGRSNFIVEIQLALKRTVNDAIRIPCRG